MPTVVRFDAELDNVAGVRRSIELLEDQALVELHNGIQQAFGWMDDHLYSFWLDGRFHGDRSTEYAAPIEPEEDVATAAVAISKLGLEPGTKIAYAFDFGDEWRVGLRLTETADAEEARYPRVVA